MVISQLQQWPHCENTPQCLISFNSVNLDTQCKPSDTNYNSFELWPRCMMELQGCLELDAAQITQSWISVRVQRHCCCDTTLTTHNIVFSKKAQKTLHYAKLKKGGASGKLSTCLQIRVELLRNSLHLFVRSPESVLCFKQRLKAHFYTSQPWATVYS